MPLYYQARDAEFIDYKPWLICEKANFFVRGPKLQPADLNQGNYFSVLGAAETVGVLVQTPYGAVLADRIKIPCLNLGKGGGGALFFIRPVMQEVIDYIDKGKFLILTLMSARQTSNSLFKSKDGTSQCIYNDVEMLADRAWELIIEAHWHDKSFLKNFVLEVRETYVNEYLQLLKTVKVPVILFYFSQRKPKYTPGWKKKQARSIWAKFPHLVDQQTIKKILAQAHVTYAKCVSRRGIPYTLKDKTGQEKPLWEPTQKKFQKFHSYYPSPEMHEDAAKVLLPICRKILQW